MSSFQGGFTPHELKTSIIQITNYQSKNFEGTLENAFYEEKQAFTNLTQMLLLIENLQDTLCYPQKGMEIRRFKECAPAVPQVPKGDSVQGAAKATFKLNIYFRQNASWQGNVVWVEKGLEAQFRSALELVHLMDSVLE